MKTTEVIRFSLMQSNFCGIETNVSIYEPRESGDEVEYALEYAYDRCNYTSSFEEVSELAGMPVIEVISNFNNGKRFRVEETNNTEMYCSWEECI